ncbi:hypothetical protein HanLR1_Chr17g0671081 [Helianthus annuus]|nr:hypothetical protein HanHA89_Chr17g0712571 [Helianthus annuus]KAJ0632955.1 hypothetical protein HanLR1_Chr17g0671081 [Helianthus annuus]
MDFHSLTRKELQSLCKLNKIPANLTNVSMADALQSLDVVVGIEEYLNTSQSETVESAETVEVPSPKAPQTRCRTSTRQKAKPTETESLQTTVTRTTRRGSKQLPKEVEESKNDQLKTPAVSRTSRKAPVTTARRNVSNQLNECENEPKEEGLVENRYSTRRSTRVTEKKSAAPRGKKGVEKAVKIDSLLDQGNSSAEVEDVCNTFEKLDVEVIEEEVTHESVEEAEDSGEVNSLKEDVDLEHNLNISTMKIDQVSDVKPESDGISGPSEELINLKEDLEDDLKTDQVCDLKPDSDENLVQKVDSGDDLMKEHNSVVVQEEHSECLLESGDDAADMEHEDTPCVDSEMVIDNSENPIDELTTKEPEEMSENTVDAISTIDDHSITEEVEDNVTEDSGPTQNPSILSEVTGHPTPFKKATPFKKMTEEVEMSEEVEDKKPEFFTENTDAGSGLTQHPSENTFNVVSDDKENKVDEGKIRKKESLNDLSIRQLKKQLKALTLKSLDSNKEEAAATGTRPALQALCDNQMMASSETAN